MRAMMCGNGGVMNRAWMGTATFRAKITTRLSTICQQVVLNCLSWGGQGHVLLLRSLPRGDFVESGGLVGVQDPEDS
jgi:hypothetical protein